VVLGDTECGGGLYERKWSWVGCIELMVGYLEPAVGYIKLVLSYM
jgi:hypothetical protein